MGLPVGWNWAIACFTRFLRPVIRVLRNPPAHLPSFLLLGICASIYLDDLLLLIRVGQPAQLIIDAAAQLYTALGLTIKVSKSVLRPAE